MGDLKKIEDYAFVDGLYTGSGLLNCSLDDFYCYSSFVPELSPIAFNGHASRFPSDDDMGVIDMGGTPYYVPRYFTFSWWEMEYIDGSYRQKEYHTETYYQYYLIEHATLHVPANLVESYKQTFPWNMFGNIVVLTEEDYAEGIEDLTPTLSQGEGAIFNLNGQRINGLQKGLNIVDGKKVWVK